MEDRVSHIPQGISSCDSQNVKQGEIVLVHDDTPIASWKLAVIEDVVTRHDGHIRAVNIRTNNGRTNRPISKLYLLEITSEIDAEPVLQKPGKLGFKWSTE